ncbi:protein of unassigned function [Methylobacterium oryzae CBMB20]|uniref:Protein of unassigned function n=1 Tax=Methylobacterium oryzae CBMB20 TaxID=693986 RepID=A0A089NN47_9HYPH|nr:protein of unassigned function [Methylobacterium oryzae CBMB20]
MREDQSDHEPKGPRTVDQHRQPVTVVFKGTGVVPASTSVQRG